MASGKKKKKADATEIVQPVEQTTVVVSKPVHPEPEPLDLDHYEVAKRKKSILGRVVSTNYRNYFVKFGHPKLDAEFDQNATPTIWENTVFSLFKTEDRKSLIKLRWLDVGASTGWFAFSVAAALRPKVVMTWEANANKFSYLRTNHQSNDRTGIIATAFGTVVHKRERGTHTASIPFGVDGNLRSNGQLFAECPIQEFSKLCKSYRFNAVRFNMGGLERDILLNDDFKKFDLVIWHHDASVYSEEESAKIMKRLSKKFKHTISSIEAETGSGIVIFHNFGKEKGEPVGQLDSGE